MRREVNNVISVAWTFLRITVWKIRLMGSLHVKGAIQRISPNVVCEFNQGSKVNVGRTVRIHSGSKIKARKGSNLTIGDNVRINYNCMIVCHDAVTIGAGTEFGPNVLVYDHDHTFRGGVLKMGSFECSPVEIGENCWIGAGTIILRGTKIRANSVVAAGSIVKGEFPSDSLILQRRTTEVRGC